MTSNEILCLLEKQRAYYRSGATIPVSFRIVQLKKLYAAVKKYQTEINDALKSDLGSLSLSLMFFGVMGSRLTMAFSKISPVKYIKFAGIFAGVFMLAALPFRNGAVMCAGIFACGLMFGAFIPCVLDVGCAATPESTMFATTAMMLAVYLGQAVAPPVIGALASAFSMHAGMIFCAAFMFLCSVFCRFAKLPENIR
jgi:predicted MFS family arabinose efflux permease